MADNIKINEGTQTDVAADEIGGVKYPRVKLTVGADGVADDLAKRTLADNLGNGSFIEVGAYNMIWNTSVWERMRGDLGDGGASTGMVNMVPMVYNGATYDRLRGGTSGLTVQVNTKPFNSPKPYGTRGTTAEGTWGTIAAGAGAGTRHFIIGVDIVVVSGTVDCAIAMGTAGSLSGTSVLARGAFTPNTGITKAYAQGIQTGTGGTITYWMGGAGTVDFNVTYWTGV